MPRFIFLTCVALSLAINTLPAPAGGKKSDSVVKITSTATKPDASGKQTLTVTLTHDKDWHTYANPVGNDDFDSNKTLVTINVKGKPAKVKVEYPAGKVHKDKIVGDYKTYEEQTRIQATVQREPGDANPLEISVRIIACNDKIGMCLLPATVKLTVP
jgi:hypothetical protein